MFIQYILQLPKVICSAIGLGYVGIFIKEISEPMREKATIRKKRKDEERKQQRQEKVHRGEAKRQKNNALYIDNSTKELKRYEQTIHAKITSLQQAKSFAAVDYSFDKKIQRLISDASKFKKDILYSSTREITDGIRGLTKEAENLDRKVQSVCENQEKVKQRIASVRQFLKSKDTHIERHLKLYEELMGPIELTPLLRDQRFEDYHAIAKNILAELSVLVKLGGKI